MPDKYKNQTTTSLYRTYSLLEKGEPDAVTNVVNPSEEAIKLAKHTVDENEK